MNQLVIIAADGIVEAARLFLISAGLTLVFGVLRILNMAHGSLYALGAYVGAIFVLGFPTELPKAGMLGALVLAALVVGLLAGPLIERGVLRWIYRRDDALQLLATYAILLILEDATKLIFGVNPYFASEPYALLGNVSLAGIPYAWYSFFVLGVAVIAGVLLWLFLNRTRTGRLVAAVIFDREISAAMGINAPRIFTVTFTIGAGLAALGGAFTAPIVSVVPGIGVDVIVLAFAVIVIGGLGSIEGAAIGALIVGLSRAGAVHLVPQLELFTVYIVMAAILILRPRGLFAGEEARRI